MVVDSLLSAATTSTWNMCAMYIYYVCNVHLLCVQCTFTMCTLDHVSNPLV